MAEQDIERQLYIHIMESWVLKMVFLKPNLIVPPICPELCSGISITTGCLVSGSNSVELASFNPTTFLANSMTAHCIPRHTPRIEKCSEKSQFKCWTYADIFRCSFLWQKMSAFTLLPQIDLVPKTSMLKRQGAAVAD